MHYCVVVGCVNGRKRKNKLASQNNVDVEKKSRVSFFGKPRDPNVLNMWECKIPKERAVLPNHYYVCHEHFEESQIIKDDVTIINGEEIKLPRIRWKLKVGAFPTIFKGTPVKLLSKKTVRKPPTVRLPLGKVPKYTAHYYSAASKKKRSLKKKVSRDNEVDQSVDTNPADSLLIEKQPEEQIVENDELEPPTQHFSADEAYHIQLPSSYWYVRKTSTADSCNFFEIVVKDVTVVIEKNVNIDFKNHKVSVTFQSRKVPNFEGTCIPSTSKDMEALLLSIHESKMCPGIMHNPLKHPHHTEVVRNGNLISNIWRANSCEIMIATDEESKKACPGCKLLDISLKKQYKRQQIVNTLLNHRYISLKQLAWKKLSQKGKNELQLKKKTGEKNI